MRIRQTPYCRHHSNLMGAKGVQRERVAAEPLIAQDEPAPFVVENARGG
jgi:hypothetical protein